MKKTVKTKTYKKYAFVSLVLAMIAITLCATLTVNLTQRANAYATDCYATFLTIRTGVTGSLRRSENPQTPALPLPGNTRSERRRNHASFEFQRNSQNFAHAVTGACIADIRDEHHLNALRDQSNAILGSGVPVSDQSRLIWISHGQGGRASDWSNVGRDTSRRRYRTWNLYFRYDSLIEQLRRKFNANVYVARSYIYNIRYMHNVSEELLYN